MEYDSSNKEFVECLNPKFRNHATMDWHTKNALWIYWKRSEDEETLDPEDTDSHDDIEIAEIFKIETNLFCCETPSCKTIVEPTNPLLTISNASTKNITDNEPFDKDAWISTWGYGIPWVCNEPWLDNDWGKRSLGNIIHTCSLIRMKRGFTQCPSCNWEEDEACNEGDLPGIIHDRANNQILYKNYEWYDGLEYGELKEKL
ncbi:hypothetical protein Tco_1552696 [Tanacetum coccineum]